MNFYEVNTSMKPVSNQQREHSQHPCKLPGPSQSLPTQGCPLSWHITAKVSLAQFCTLYKENNTVCIFLCPASSTQDYNCGGFPDGPVVRTPCFHCREHRFDLKKKKDCNCDLHLLSYMWLWSVSSTQLQTFTWQMILPPPF